MRIVLVLGAGATLAHAKYLRGLGSDGDLPPLDATFFDRLCELGIDVDGSLRDYAKELLGIDPFAPGEPKPGMESFFKDVFYDFISGRAKPTAPAERYAALVSAYREVLLKTTNWVCEGADSGPVTDLVGAAADAAEQVDIITFNHDLLLENILAELDSARGRWCLRHGYGHFAAKRHFTSQSGSSNFEDPQECKHEKPVRVYKLHGSLNWYVDSDTPAPDRGVLRGERETNQKVYVTRRRRIPHSLRRKGGAYSWPVLIPPVYAKQPFIRSFMAPVWRDARDAIATSDLIVSFGYSLPPLDIEAEKELQRAIARNDKLRHIDLINPDPISAGRYAGAFPRQAVHWQADLTRFLDGKPFA